MRTLVRYARRKAGLTQRELALRAGASQPAIARIEGGGVPRADTLVRLLRACGFDLDIQVRAGAGVDRGAIRELLRLTPAERARLAVAEAQSLAAVPRGGRRT